MAQDNTPTYNAGNRTIVHFKDFLQNLPKEEKELKDIKKSFKKNELEIGNKEHKLKFNRVTHKLDDLVEDEVDDKLETFEENVSESEFVDEFLDRLYMNGTKENGNYVLTLTQATNAANEIYNQYFKLKS